MRKGLALKEGREGDGESDGGFAASMLATPRGSTGGAWGLGAGEGDDAGATGGATDGDVASVSGVIVPSAPWPAPLGAPRASGMGQGGWHLLACLPIASKIACRSVLLALITCLRLSW